MTTAAEILSAKSPNDVFANGDHAKTLKRLRAEIHPDRFTDDTERELATKAFQRLTALYDELTKPVDNRVTIKSKKAVYAIDKLFATGDIADVHLAGDRWLLKTCRDARDTDLMRQEVKALKKLRNPPKTDSVFPKYLPIVVESFDLTGKDRRPVTVFELDVERVTVQQIRKAYQKGIEPRHVAWMFNRLLEILGYAHQSGLVHGAVVPSHVLISPSDHGLILVDWTASVAIGSPLRIVSPDFEQWYPASAKAKGNVGPGADLFMAAKCAVYLLGGDPIADEFPRHVPEPMRRLLRACLIQSEAMRPQDAWKLQDDWREILERLYGPPRFVPFVCDIPKET